MTPNTISLFPHDVERLIFEEAARLRPKKCIPLMLVARRVHEWVLPEVYEAVVVHNLTSPTTMAMMRAIESKSAGFLARSVKTLVVSDRIPVDDAQALMKKFPGVLRLCCHTQHSTLFDIAYQTPIRPTELSVLADLFFRTAHPLRLQGVSPFFQNLTHLELFFDRHLPGIWDTLCHIPNLTHLVLQPEYWDANYLSPIKALFEHCGSLLLIVAVEQSFGGNVVPEKISGCDARLVVLDCATLHERWTGESDIWHQVEKVIRERDVFDVRFEGLDLFDCVHLIDQDRYKDRQ